MRDRAVVFPRQWLYQMADLCERIATQARDVATAHRAAFDDHVSLPKGYLSDVPALDQPFLRYDHQRLVAMPTYYIEHPENITMRQQYGAAFVRFQQKSEEVVAEFTRAAAVRPVTPPPKPPTAPKIDAPVRDTPGGDNPRPGFPDGGGPSPDDELPDLPTLPSTGTPPVPTPDTAALTDAMTYPIAGGTRGASTGSGLKPASFGGGALGGGVPSMPLKSPFSPESSSPSVGAAAARDVAGLGRAFPGGAMGGGGMGMPPMGGGRGAGQGENKGKRAQGNDESLYTEDRWWTEGIIGRRQPRKAG